MSKRTRYRINKVPLETMITCLAEGGCLSTPRDQLSVLILVKFNSSIHWQSLNQLKHFVIQIFNIKSDVQVFYDFLFRLSQSVLESIIIVEYGIEMGEPQNSLSRRNCVVTNCRNCVVKIVTSSYPGQVTTRYRNSLT